MQLTQTRKILTHHAVLKMLEAGIIKSEEINQPQCLVIVDFSGELLGEIRMNGAKYLSRKSAAAKARTAASICAPTTHIPQEIRSAIAAATQGEVTGLPGGMPIMLEGECVGGIGVGSGSGDEDIIVAKAMLESIGIKE